MISVAWSKSFKILRYPQLLIHFIPATLMKLLPGAGREIFVRDAEAGVYNRQFNINKFMCRVECRESNASC
jgi:hypothetical protein